MKYLFLATSSFLVIITQMIAGNSFFLLNFLDLSLILITYWAIFRSRRQTLFVGSLTGLLLDATLAWPLGYNGFGKTLAAFFICVAVKRFNLEGAGVRFALISTCSFISSLCVFILFVILQRMANTAYLASSLMQAIVTGVVGVLFLSLVDTMNRVRANRMS